jgi:SRSO17 transposase
VGLESDRRSSESRFAVYVDALTTALGHADRGAPFRSYCSLLLPGRRKSVEPMAARVAPGPVQATHQSLHHLVAKANWSDEAVLSVVRQRALPAIERHGAIRAWIIDDTGFPKKGTHSVGVARQYCGQLGKQDNCQVAVSLSVANDHASLPIAYRLYLPQAWADDQDRRRGAGVPDAMPLLLRQAQRQFLGGFRLTHRIAADQLWRAAIATPALRRLRRGPGAQTLVEDWMPAT